MFVDRKKKLNKPNKLIKTIKTEPQDLQALAQYIEDPVELLQQAFQCLKSKTIKSLSPDLFQKFSIDEVHQFCLDEIMGISKKRLLSIINGTKCPTDTEDSDDSDVKDIEEHVSLEEISSDSDVGPTKKKKLTSKSSTVNKKKNAGGTAAGDGGGGGGGKDKAAGSGEGKQQMSVLELLELQARARAIRSQLALEPITKIELDSENEENKVNQSENKVIKETNNTSAPTTTESVRNKINRTKNVAPTVKPIRLKRNFRQRQNGTSDEEEIAAPTTAAAAEEPTASDDKTNDTEIINKSNCVNDKKINVADQVVVSPKEIENNISNTIQKNDDGILTDSLMDANKQNSSNAGEKEHKERSASPDLITIVPSPETFCISSESENEDMEFLKTIKNSGKYIDYNAITVKNKSKPTEDELFLNKIKQTTTEKSLTKPLGINNDGKVNNDTVMTEDIVTAEITATKNQESEQEEGELTSENDDEVEDDDDVDESCKTNTTVNDASISNDESLNTSTNVDTEIVDLSNNKIQQEQEQQQQTEDYEIKVKSNDSNNDLSESNKPTPTMELAVSAATSKLKDDNIEIINDEDDEDVIDLGKDEEIDEFDLIKEDPPKPIEEKPTPDHAEEVTENDSWGARWLRGRNVAKVLATSRIGNKVRSKIKQTKKNKAAALESKNNETKLNEENDAKLSAATTTVLNNEPAIEVGSVEHYENLQATADLKK